MFFRISFNDFLFPLMEWFNHKLAGDTGYAPILSDSKSDLLLLQSIPSYKNGRNDRTRTCNLLAPNQAVYY